MELPITRPSKISYADELNFSELLGELKSKRYNGFIRVTSDSEEGHILFKDGKQVAASYDNDSKVEAIKKIKSAANIGSTVVEVFDLRESQVNYLMDVNKAYLIDSGSEIHDMLDELKKATSEDEIEPTSPEEKSEDIKVEVPDNTEIIENDVKSSPVEEIQQEAEIKPDPEISKETEIATEEISPEVKVETKEPEVKVETKEPEVKVETKEPEVKVETKEPEVSIEEKVDTVVKESAPEEVKSKEPEFVEEPVDRAELMKKYGLKDVGEEEVENILDSYKGGSLSDEDIEKIELTLMNKIKKSILGIPKIKGTEVMVFLENAGELSGTINIITEYESQGFLSRIIGDSNNLGNLKSQIINITQIEIRKSFRGYPEIVDNFKINVEVS